MDERFPFHTPVMVEEVISLLEPRSSGCYLDGTVGGAGHARAILEASSPEGRLYALDQDSEAIAEAATALKPFGERVLLRKGNFSRASEIFPEVSFDGILLDLGVSSYQLDTPERGFSCDQDGPLDMRMDQSCSLTAADLLNSLDEDELTRVFRDFGESPFCRRIAREIIRQRQRKPLQTTAQLAELIRRVVPRKSERKSLVVIFQALRIRVNSELDSLKEGLKELFRMLAVHGRMAVISYHSLEDRTVKRFFSELADRCICPPELPYCACGRVPWAQILTKKPLVPSKTELASNPRSRSARLRAIEKIAGPGV